jgi:hypothetical protein
VAEEQTDSAVPSPEEAEAEESVTELLEQLGREVATLVYYESRLVASRHEPELRRAARHVVAVLGAVAAFVTAFVLANESALLALSTVLAGWLAALLLALAWAGVGALLALALWTRAKRVAGREPRTIEEARDRAEQAVRTTLERLAPVVTREIALAAVPMASGIAEMGGDLVEGADEVVDSITEELPGGGVVNQVWDFVLAPGRFGIRVATTVLKRDEPG